MTNLFHQQLPENVSIEAFLCDDGSRDGTGEMLKEKFPFVNVVRGDGNQFWGGGMRMAWELAQQKGGFDFYLWLNDDTFLIQGALTKLFKDYLSLKSPGSIITAACRNPVSKDFSFGGSDDLGPVVPNGTPQPVKWINGNMVLIPLLVVQKVGIISPEFTHYLGDYDYGLRAQTQGVQCYTSSEYLADCEPNPLPYWGNSEISLSKRWELLHSVKGLALTEYTKFLKRHFGKSKAYKNLISSYTRVLFPRLFVQVRDIF